MPTKHRERLQSVCDGQMVATIDTQVKALLIYPLPTWEDIEQEIQALPAMDPAIRRFQRLMIGYATDLEFDSNGRFVLPQSLRDYAELDKKVVLVGQVKKFELWDEEHWVAERSKAIEERNSGETPIPEEMRSIVF